MLEINIKYQEDVNLTRMLKIEFSRALKSKLFLFAVLFGCVLAISHFIFNILPMPAKIDFWLSYDKPMLDMDYLFPGWMGGNQHDFQGYLLYLILPILATLPYADSFFSDKKSGFIKNILVRTSKKKYYLSKYIVVFVTGGIVVVLPLLLNLTLSAMVLPSITPEVVASHFLIRETSMWYGLFYSHPYIYIFLFLLIDFVFSGLFATLALAADIFAEYRVIALLSPFLIYLFINQLFRMASISNLSPMNFLQPSYNESSFIVIFIEFIILLVLSYFGFLYYGKKNDAF